MFQKKGVGTRRLISRGLAARDGSAVKSHSNILQRLRHQISLDYYTIPPARQARTEVFWGVHFSSSEFLGFRWKPEGFFLAFDFCPLSIIHVTLITEYYTPPIL